MFKKAQAAMEFLMTYGWAILVVLVAIGALAYFGVLNPGKYLPSSCTITPGISCDDFYVRSDGTASIILRNGMGSDLSTVALEIKSSTCAEIVGNPNPTAISDGSTGTFNFDSCTAGSAGGQYKKDVEFSYKTSTTGLLHNKTGTLSVSVE